MSLEYKDYMDHSTASFAFPLSSVIFKPTSTAFFTIFSFCFAEIYHVDISASWLLLVALLAPLLTMALPPIAGSGILAFSILFSRLGIPTEALVVVSAVEVLSDFIDTGFNVMLRVMHLAGYAAKLGKVDRGVLSNEND